MKVLARFVRWILNGRIAVQTVAQVLLYSAATFPLTNVLCAHEQQPRPSECEISTPLDDVVSMAIIDEDPYTVNGWWHVTTFAMLKAFAYVWLSPLA
ncbi:hypothetical protein DACRYDRAFT_116308 [Dacryopinax primogenitus]|uniref:Uncharacterized protein n=1 Tax=Dacryopinax primogenitus (strain DJM 731) TaxID=1858805 RepID=M5G140_DACPD|nr:uncharacterized protein DACRYDRAFT_116308 [Dacryopinax primogenitus]EJU01880.1 hypothetical protein DACRYDRAFT_116308 [Dacryopinax primogenitus]